MSGTPWKLLSVAEFLDRYREQPQLKTTKLELNDLIWQKQTVQSFFDNYQWIPKVAVLTSSESFDLRLPVLSYFQHFAWDAPVQSFKPSTPSIKPEARAENSISIQNLSDLF